MKVNIGTRKYIGLRKTDNRKRNTGVRNKNNRNNRSQEYSGWKNLDNRSVGTWEYSG